MLIRNRRIFKKITISVLYLMSILTRKNVICDTDLTSILLHCHFEKNCTHHSSLERKCVIMLINASGVKISNRGANYSRCLRGVYFKDSHMVFMKLTGLACPLLLLLLVLDKYTWSSPQTSVR